MNYEEIGDQHPEVKKHNEVMTSDSGKRYVAIGDVVEDELRRIAKEKQIDGEMTLERVREILSVVEFKEVGSIDYEFVAGERGGEIYLQAQYFDTDVVTGEKAIQKTRKWFISKHAVKSEVVFTALKCVLTSVEHRVRENFKYRGKRIAGPHFDVDALWEIADRNRFLDYRDNPAKAKAVNG